MIDIAVIGAGMTGLVCAQQLQHAGYRVLVVEKSRGLGGRVATRRLANTWADHGTRYLTAEGQRSQPCSQQFMQFIQHWCDRQIVHEWAKPYQHVAGRLTPLETTQSYYVAKDGITAIAKSLAAGLEIARSQRVIAMQPSLLSEAASSTQHWNLTLELPESAPRTLAARAVVVAIPAPQALTLLEPLTAIGLSQELLDSLRSVQFAPCLSAIATYAPQQFNVDSLPWRGVLLQDDPDLSWVSLESSKQAAAETIAETVAEKPVLVVQSTAEFANQHLEAIDLHPAGYYLLKRAAAILLAGCDRPQELQVHRWRYAFAQTPLTTKYLSTTAPLPLVCGGDWCGSGNLESAFESGLATAEAMNRQLDHRSIPDLTPLSWS